MLITSLCLLAIFTNTLAKSSTSCNGVAEYSQCSVNKECGCLHRSESTDDSGICGLVTLSCSTLNPCASNGKTCHDKNHICIRHPICDFRPVCYPLNKATDEICPSADKTSTSTSRPTSTSSIPIPPQCDWTKDGVTVLDQLKGPSGLFIDENDGISVYVADSENHRIVKWNPEQSLDTPVVIPINIAGKLSSPRDIIINKKDGTMFICDKGNKRILRLFNGTTNSQILLSDVECESLIMDKQGALIVSEFNNNRVTKWEGMDQAHSSEKVIAGSYYKGLGLNQLNHPRDIFIDEQDQSIYISDSDNHRIIKWKEGDTEGIVVAGGNGRGKRNDQLSHPRGIALHPNGDLYIADTSNNRIVRWTPGQKSGTVVVDGNFVGHRQLAPEPYGLIFDQHYHNLYVTDWTNSRLMRFYIDGTGNCATIT